MKEKIWNPALINRQGNAPLIAVKLMYGIQGGQKLCLKKACL